MREKGLKFPRLVDVALPEVIVPIWLRAMKTVHLSQSIGVEVDAQKYNRCKNRNYNPRMIICVRLEFSPCSNFRGRHAFWLYRYLSYMVILRVG